MMACKIRVALVSILFLAGMALMVSCEPSQPTIPLGVFLDSAVKGLFYSTPTQQGITDENGEFDFLDGETVTFSIGGIVLGSGTSKTIMTPVDLVVGAITHTDPEVTNISRLLQTLDDDGDPSSGILITEAVRVAAAGSAINFNQSIAEFEADSAVQTIVSTLTSLTTAGQGPLVPVQAAQDHLLATITCGDSACLHGTCVNGSCECDAGYTGQFCEMPPRGPCETEGCSDHGTCVDGICQCDAGYFGEYCDDFVVIFPDPGLLAAIRDEINKPSGEIFYSDLKFLTDLYAGYRNITNIAGLEYCTNLKRLDIWVNSIVDINPLAGLVNLISLSLSDNQISDISPLVANPGIDNQDGVILFRNPLNEASCAVLIPTLEGRGVHVYSDCP